MFEYECTRKIGEKDTKREREVAKYQFLMGKVAKEIVNQEIIYANQQIITANGWNLVW